MSASTKKTTYNVGGAIVGFLLATLAIWGLVESQQPNQPPTYNAKISYDG